jgi:large subunit ribosomal protein L4
MQADVKNMKGETVKTVELPAEIFEAPINKDLMHQAYVRQMANARLGTHSTKTRGEVSGGGKKPWKQKGTGRARQGSTRAPQWRGGGKVHTPKPHSYRQAMPRQMRRAALRSALSVKAADAQIVVIDDLIIESAKTKAMAITLAGLVGEGQTALILLGERNEAVEQSLRNLPQAKLLRANYLNIRDLLGCDKVLLPLGALAIIQGYLG